MKKNIENTQVQKVDHKKNNVDSLSKIWKVSFKKGKPYLNYFNVFYAMPKRISLYFIIFSFLTFVGFASPLGIDYVFGFLLGMMDAFPPNLRLGLAWASVISLLVLQFATIGYAFLSKESLAKAKMEIETKIIWVRALTLFSILINIWFSITVLLIAGYGLVSPGLTWTGIGVSIVLLIITYVLYRYQHRQIQLHAFNELKEQANILVQNDEIIKNASNIDVQELVLLNNKSVLKNKEAVRIIEALIDRNKSENLSALTQETEIKWLEKTRLWNWKFTKSFVKWLETKDIISKYERRKEIRKINRELKKLKTLQTFYTLEYDLKNKPIWSQKLKIIWFINANIIHSKLLKYLNKKIMSNKFISNLIIKRNNKKQKKTTKKEIKKIKRDEYKKS